LFCDKVIKDAGPLSAFITERSAWNANSCWTCQEISRLLWNPNVDNYVHKKELTVLNFCQFIPVHILLSCSLGCILLSSWVFEVFLGLQNFRLKFAVPCANVLRLPERSNPAHIVSVTAFLCCVVLCRK